MTSANIIAACATNSAHATRNTTPTVYFPRREIERPVIGMIKIYESCDVAVNVDHINDEFEIRFRSVSAVNELIRKLQNLERDMIKEGYNYD